MPLIFDRTKTSKRSWGSVLQRGALGQQIAQAYARGDLTKAGVRQVYAHVPDLAFTESAGGASAFDPAKATSPFYELIGEALVLNPDGLNAAAHYLGDKGAGKKELSATAFAEARARVLNAHREYRLTVPAAFKLPRAKLARGQALTEAQTRGGMGFVMSQVYDDFREQFPRTVVEDEISMGYPSEVLQAPYIVDGEIFADYVVVKDADCEEGEFYKVSYTITAGAYIFASREQWEPIELTYKPRAAEPLAESRTTNKGKHFDERISSHFELVESADENPDGPWKIRAVGITANVVNENKRRYSASVLERAVAQMKSHLNESAGQGRLFQVLGEPEHPQHKSGRPSLLETVVRWDDVRFDGTQVLLEGKLLGTGYGRDIRAQIRGGVYPDVSQRSYGDSQHVRIGGEVIEDVTECVITGYDLIASGMGSDPAAAVTFVESKPLEAKVDPKELKALFDKHPELFEGLLDDKIEKLGDAQLKKLEESLRAKLGLDEKADLGKALDEAAAAVKTLADQKHDKEIDEAITTNTKALPYGDAGNKRLIEAVRSAKPANAEAVKTLVESKRKEYDGLAADLRLIGMGMQPRMVGSVLEQQTGTPEYARMAHYFGEALVRGGHVKVHDLVKPVTRAELFAQQMLERFDKLHQHQLARESKLLDEAETTSDLNVPYSVSRMILQFAMPELMAPNIFDTAPTDQAPSRIYFESRTHEANVDMSITDEVVVAGDPALSQDPATAPWVQMAHKSIKRNGTVVTHTSGAPTYVEGTDYLIDRFNGKFLAMNGGVITSGQSLKIDYLYEATRQGENVGIERGKTTLAFKTLEIAADRLATAITSEAIAFSRTQLGWDAVSRTLAGLISDTQIKIDDRLFNLAVTVARTLASNVAGTWNSATDPIENFVQLIGQARVKVENRYYKPTFVLMSKTNSDLLANWGNPQGLNWQRADAELLGDGYVGRIKGLPVYASALFSDTEVLVGNRELVAYRVYQPMLVKGPFPTYDSSQRLVAADQYYTEEYNGADAPKPEKGSIVLIV